MTQTLVLLLAFIPTQGGVHLTAKNAVHELSPGINLGNTLEAIPEETSWGNPKPTSAAFVAMRKAGFKSVRIPVAWSQYADANHEVKREWMDHVADVVKMANTAGLYAMINVHWDGGWMQPTKTDQIRVNEKLRSLWTQIGTRFKDWDEKLLLAGTNEVHVEGNYDAPSAENAEVQNGFNQIFVDTVRATGARNRDRFLVIQGYNTNIDHTAKFNATLPKDSAKGRLMMEVHHYSPYNFTLNDKSDIWQWGAGATDPNATETWANEAYVDAQFELMKAQFVDKGVPVILGEYGANLKKRFPGMRTYQLAWNGYVTRSAVTHGIVPMLWDIGLESGLFNRTTGAVQDPEMIQRLVESGTPK